METTMERLAIRTTRGAGRSLTDKDLDSLYLTDLNRNPLRKPYGPVEPGRIVIESAPGPFVIVIAAPVEGFGSLFLFADNEGEGYRPSGEIDLYMELARSRLHAVQTRRRLAEKDGTAFPASIAQRLDRAVESLRKASHAEAGSPGAAAFAEESLADSLWAGEELVLEIARRQIARRGPREGFLFGCNAFGLSHGPQYTQPLEALFNFATVPFYRRGFEPQEGRPDASRADAITAWLNGSKIAAKGHPLTWFHEAGVADWMKTKTFGENLASARARCRTLARQYAGRIDRWDVINEAHDWANELGYSADQLMELTRASCEGTREGNPSAQTVVNSCCVFGEYAATGKTYFRQEERPLRTPHQYLRACLGEGLDFDVIGLQLYYPGYDMFELDRLLDWYAALGKPLHITELGVSSAPGADPRAHVKTINPSWWHGPWSEGVQADWIEQFYTLCYAKPAVEAITWWDFADAGHFWPHGGFLRPDFTPKEAYGRLKALIGGWGKM
jgi:GH35 family endo-1,4-beta-xylanase